MDKCRIILILAERIICRSKGHGLFATTSLLSSLSVCLVLYFLDTDITPVSLQMSLQAAGGKQTLGAPCSWGIHYPSPNLYTNGPAILLCLHFSSLPSSFYETSGFRGLSSSEVLQGCRHFFIDGLIIIRITATFEMEDLGCRADLKGIQLCDTL